MPFSLPPWISRGAKPFPSLLLIWAPIRLNGSITRCIGRCRSEESPSSRLVKGRPAKTPDRSRMAVPELPQSTVSLGLDKRSHPFPSIQRRSPSDQIFTPISLKAWTVLRLSSPPDRLKMVLRPCAILAKITARWPMDLSPGTLISPRRGRLVGSIRFMS